MYKAHIVHGEWTFLDLWIHDFLLVLVISDAAM